MRRHVHGYYWNDDPPMMYFQDVRDRPRYCASHVVPLEELSSDLANPATTPNFAWVAPDDCADMEGCGIAAGDEFLKTELTAITELAGLAHPAVARDYHVRRGRPGLPAPGAARAHDRARLGGRLGRATRTARYHPVAAAVTG